MFQLFTCERPYEGIEEMREILRLIKKETSFLKIYFYRYKSINIDPRILRVIEKMTLFSPLKRYSIKEAIDALQALIEEFQIKD